MARSDPSESVQGRGSWRSPRDRILFLIWQFRGLFLKDLTLFLLLRRVSILYRSANGIVGRCAPASGYHSKAVPNRSGKLAGARRGSAERPYFTSAGLQAGFWTACERVRLRDGHSSGTPVTRRLKQPTRTAGSGHRSRSCAFAQPSRRPYSVLLPVGFALPLALPPARCALTASFHPCRGQPKRRGGMFSVALSLGSHPPDVIRHRLSAEPGLSSPTTFRFRRSGRPTD